MPIQPWKIIQSAYPRKELRVDTCELPNGRIIEKMIHEYSTWVTVMALTDTEEVILIRQYRHGSGKVIWEFPAGIVDPGETPLDAAKRELLEESGYGGGIWVNTGFVSPNPDNHTNLLHTFLATNVKKEALQDLDDSEQIDVYPTPLMQVIRMAKEGELLQAMQVSALFFALTHLNRIA